MPTTHLALGLGSRHALRPLAYGLALAALLAACGDDDSHAKGRGESFGIGLRQGGLGEGGATPLVDDADLFDDHA